MATDAPAPPPGSGGIQAAIIGFAVRFRGIIFALAILMLGYGAVSVLRAKYDVFPAFAPPHVGILTEAPCLSSLQVVVLFTFSFIPI